MKNIPFLLNPAAKNYLWGGNRLNEEFAKNIDIFPLAETWECSTHPDGQSKVGSGRFKGMTLGDALKIYPEMLGTHPLEAMKGTPELPILIKLIDAKQDLSVQVHPDDEYAGINEDGQLGKTEMWYILQARKGAELVCGFRQNMDKSRIKETIKNGTFNKYLLRSPVYKNDVFYIEPGTVHAIGAGLLVAEIQESSNLTYRIYDYERADSTGKQRPLHLEKALEVAKLTSSPEPRQPMRVLKYKKGCACELLTRCKYFQVERLLLNTEVCRELADYETGGNSFHALLCIDGCGILIGKGFMLNFFRGDCVFVPANSIELKLHGRAQMLDVSC